MSYTMNPIEMIRLSRRAGQDVKRDLFRDYVVIDPKTGLRDHFVISNYITYDLSRFEQIRSHLHVGRRYLFWTPLVKQRLRRFRCLSMVNALAAINNAYTDVQSQIHLAYADFNKTMDFLSEQAEQYTQDNAPHYVRVCHNKSTEARARFQKTTYRLYGLAVALLNQKIRILTRMMNRSELARSMAFQRVRYYYERAAARDPKLPVQYLSDERLGMVANMSPIHPTYYRELVDTHELLESLTKEIDALFPGRTEGIL